MAWNTSKSTTTKHTCGGPVFGKLTAGCPRCDEMIAGAPPVVWAFTSRKQEDAARSAECHAHFAAHPKTGRGLCYTGRLCTYGT